MTSLQETGLRLWLVEGRQVLAICSGNAIYACIAGVGTPRLDGMVRL